MTQSNVNHCGHRVPAMILGALHLLSPSVLSALQSKYYRYLLFLLLTL